MQTDVVILTASAVLFLAGLLFFVFGGKRTANDSDELRERLDSLTRNMNSQLQEQTGRLVESIGKVREESRTAISSSFSEAQKTLNESLLLGRKELAESMGSSQKTVSEKLERLAKESADIRNASLSMIEIGKDIRQLSEILEGGQTRGGFGEFQLGLMLKHVIPAGRYKEQYKIGDGIVDAAILLKDRVLCIDSKFPLANLQKSRDAEVGEKEKLMALFFSDVKARAKEISRKYIIPEKTLEFAIMFIPSESVFLEIINNTDLHKSILGIGVVPASPNFLYVYFQALSIGFRGLAVEAEAEEIIRSILEMKSRFEKFQEKFGLLGKHLKNAVSQFEESEKLAGKFDSVLENLKLGNSSKENKDRN